MVKPKSNLKDINSQALSKAISEMDLTSIVDRVESNSKLIAEIVDKYVYDHSGPLHKCMRDIKHILEDKKYPPTDVELDEMILDLSSYLYFAGEGMESLGIKEDISKAVRMELYNNVHVKTDGTISDKNSKAELATQKEFICYIVYQRAYKKIKLRIQASSEMLTSIKKVISRRMGAYEMTRVDSDRIAPDRNRNRRDKHNERTR